MCVKKLVGSFCCLLVAALLALLIAYGVRLGSGDEVHSLATSGTCRETSTDNSTLKIMTFNTFLIPCLPSAKCQEDDEREARVTDLTTWFQDREEDVVIFQEVWSFQDEFKEGMTSAGYCHYVMTERKARGSGLAIFSRHPIEQQEFRDWFDAFGLGNGMAPDVLNLEAYVADKGVLYAQILKNDVPIHLFNLHANSDTRGDLSNVRSKQFTKTKEFVDSLDIPSDELVLIGGDFNEDKECRLNRCEGEAKCEDHSYYKEMIGILSVDRPEKVGDNTYTYDTEVNDLLKGLYIDEDCDYYQYTLDYIFYSENHAVPSDSSCEVLNPKGEDGAELSDHLPVACTFQGLQIQMDVDSNAEIHEKEPELNDVPQDPEEITLAEMLP